MEKLFFTFILYVIIHPVTFAQETPEFITDSLDIYVDLALEQWQIPGAAVLVVKDGRVIVAKGYGVKEAGTNDKVDENTLFMIGSNTKAFTGTALALLEHEGLLNLGDKVVKYLPGFTMKDSWVTKELNIADIVTHRMGLETFQGDFMYWSSDLTSDEVIEKFGKITPLYDFRIKYGYTNAGYALAGEIIEKVSGKKWEEYIKEKIFLPLRMHRTTALSTQFSGSENIARPHTFVDGKLTVLPFENIDNLAPCGSIGSSVNELGAWLTALLDSGRYQGETVIPYKVLERTKRPESIQGRARHPFNKSHYNLYGLGWGLMDYEGTEIVSHTGGVNGFVTSVTLLPEKNLGVVILTNTDQNSFFQALKWEIIDSYLGLPYRNYSDYMFQSAVKQIGRREEIRAAWRDSVSMNIKPEIDLKEFAGIYENGVYGYAKLTSRGNYLEMQLQHHSKIRGKLEYIGNRRFLCTYSDPTYGIRVFPFEIENGRINSFDLYVDNFIEFLPYKFVKQE